MTSRRQGTRVAKVHEIKCILLHVDSAPISSAQSSFFEEATRCKLIGAQRADA